MKNLTVEQKRIIDEITKEFIAINEKQEDQKGLIDLDFLSKEKKEWEEKLVILKNRNEHLLIEAKNECQIAFEKLRNQLHSIAKVSLKSDDYGSEITIAKEYHDFKIRYKAPQIKYTQNSIGDSFYYADKVIVSGYVSGNHEIVCDTTEEFFSNEYVKNKIYRLIK
jgi:hypothetical protein